MSNERIITWQGRAFMSGEEEAVVQWGRLAGELFVEIQRADNWVWYLWAAPQHRLHVRGKPFKSAAEAKDYAETLVPDLVRLAHAAKEGGR